jgi:hypothetical protein
MVRRRSRHGGGMADRYSGAEMEMDTLSEVAPAARYNGEYLRYKEAMILAGKNQPRGWNPEDPPLDPIKFPGEIHFLTSEELLNDPDFENMTLRMYTSGGSAFDKLHGVDTFFTLSNEDGKTVFATVDVTINEDKARKGHKADVIILFPENFTDSDIYTTKKEKQLNNHGQKKLHPF